MAEIFDLDPETCYYLEVIAVNNAGESEPFWFSLHTLPAESGQLYAWGCNSECHLTPNAGDTIELPKQLTEEKFVAVTGVAADIMLINDIGEWIWFEGGNIQKSLKAPTCFTMLSCSATYTVALSTTGELW